jgi:integrase
LTRRLSRYPMKETTTPGAKLRCERSGALIVKYQYVYEDVDRHGNVRVYFWRGKGHKKIRLRERAGSPDFHRRYAELMNRDPEPVVLNHQSTANTLRWLCIQYFGSPKFKQLGRRTQYVRRRIFESMLDEPIAPGAKETFAYFPLDRLTTAALEILRDRKDGLPEAANGRVKALRGIFAWAKHMKHVRGNLAKDIEYVATDSEGWHSWVPAELEQFEQRHPVGTKARLAIDLLQYTGASRSDVIALGVQNVRDGKIRFKRAKTGVEVELPIVDALRQTIDTSPVIGKSTFLATEFGKPFTPAGFGGWFRRRCNEAGLPQCSAHGVRKAAAVRAAENGATTHELMAMFGWMTLKEAERYTRAAERRRLTGRAATLLKR